MPSAGAAPAVPQVVYSDHPDGFAHTTSSIRKIAALIREGQLSFPIVRLARRIVHDVPPKNYDAELRAIYVWAREHTRYRKDPIGAEWLQSAERTVAERAGDCDDLTILIGSLAGALGHAWRLLTVGPTPTRQAHVAIQVSTDGGASWVTLDPVMEPMQSTTALRTEVGAFGQTPRAPSVRLWDQRGEPMQLGSYPSQELKSLWLWQPYFPMGPYAQLPQRGNPDPRYRSAGAPGAPSAIMSGLGALSAGMNGCCQLGDPVYLYLDDRGVDTSRADAMGGYPYKLGSIWGSIKKIGKGVAHAASGAVRAVGKVAKAVVKSPVGKAALPVLALNVDPKLKALRNAGLKALPIPQAQMLAKVGTGAEKALAAAVAKRKPSSSGSAAGHGLPRPPTLARLTRGMARTTPAPVNIVNRIVAPAVIKAASSSAAPDAWKKPHPELRKRYPSNARQTYDARAGVFRVFIPHAGGAMSGGRMGALVPTLTLSLGAAAAGSNPTVGSQYAAAAYAQSAVNAVRAFIASRADKRPPGKALPEVKAFQVADAARSGGGVKLKVDGLWGNNTRAAAAYYLQTPVTSLPGNLPALNTALTWSPPTAPAAPAPSAPAVAPAAAPAVRPPAAVAAAPASSSAPAGYVQVGTENQNPGLPPIGAPSSSSSSAGPAAPVSSSPLQLPVTSTVAPLPVQRPEPLPGFQPPGSVTYMAPPSPAPAPMAPGAPTLVIHAPPQAPQAPVMAVAAPPALPAPPLPAGPGYAPGPVLARESGGSSSSSGKWLPWLMLFYCMRKG